MIRGIKIKNLLALFLIVGLLVGGCAKSQQAANEKSKKHNPKQLSVTYVKAPLNIPSIVDKKLGLLEKEFNKDGIEINRPEITSGPKQTEAMAAGSVDIASVLGGTSAILAAANGVDIKVIGIYSRAPQAFMIMAKNPGIRTVKDLAGKKVGGPKGTILHQLLVGALEKHNLSISAVEYISMDIPAAMSALSNGSIDAALVAGPATLKAMEAGMRVIATGEGVVDGTIVMAVSGVLLRQHPDIVNRAVKVHKQTLDLLKNKPDEALLMTAEETGLSIDSVKKMNGWYNFDPQIKPADVEELKRTQDFLVKNGMLKNRISIEQLLKPMY